MREMGSETRKRSVLGSQCHEAGLLWNLQVLPTKETWNSESAGHSWHPGPVLFLLRSLEDPGRGMMNSIAGMWDRMSTHRATNGLDAVPRNSYF